MVVIEEEGDLPYSWFCAIGVDCQGVWKMKMPPIERDKTPREVLLLFAMMNKAETDEGWGDALIEETFDD